MESCDDHIVPLLCRLPLRVNCFMRGKGLHHNWCNRGLWRGKETRVNCVLVLPKLVTHSVLEELLTIVYPKPKHCVLTVTKLQDLVFAQ